MSVIEKNGEPPRDLVCYSGKTMQIFQTWRRGFCGKRERKEENCQMWRLGCILFTVNKEACDHVASNVWSELRRALLQVNLSIGPHPKVITFMRREFRVKEFKRL